MGLLLGLMLSTLQVTRGCCAPGALLLMSPGVCVPCAQLGAVWSGLQAVWRRCGSNSVFSLCSRCSKAMFSKSLDIAEAHPQFSKEDRYTPCPPAPPPAPQATRAWWQGWA